MKATVETGPVGEDCIRLKPEDDFERKLLKNVVVLRAVVDCYENNVLTDVTFQVVHEKNCVEGL